MKSITAILVCFVVVSCKRDPPPTRVDPVVVEVADVEPNVLVPDDGATAYETERWRYPSLAQRGIKLDLVTSDNGLAVGVRGARIDVSPEFGECIDELPVVAGPEHLPSASESSRPVWATLRGEAGEAAIMLSTAGATLLVDDGCMRAADITSALLGHGTTVEDPLFTADGLVADGAVQWPDVGQADGVVSADGTAIAKFAGFMGEATVEAWQNDSRRWARLGLVQETESIEQDAVVGRDHNVWLALHGHRFEVLAQSDVRFGAEGADREDSRVRVDWSTPSAQIVAERTTQADALNVGAGRCPEMEGAVAFERVDEVVTWALRGGNGERVALGKATRRATYASGCPKVADEELRSRKKLLADRAPDEPVTVQPAD